MLSSAISASVVLPPQGELRPRIRPELLAPAGDRACLEAAINYGADAVYFGLRGHNARARATNFVIEELPEVMALLRQRGVKGYVALNTLAFPQELPGIERLVRSLTVSGVDAAIVQDIGVARLIRAITPDLEIHGSTQMSITSAAGLRMAEELGCSRVILARELSIKEIAKVRDQSRLPVEVFVHGALCVAYSGQCLTSEALGGRSANRGECAQACRMPYEVVRDGQTVDLGDIQYLLSPQDLAAFELIPELVSIGVSSLKIEGRLKSPEYVATITENYRKAIDAVLSQGTDTPIISERDRYEMEMTFSRGFSPGFLKGNNHKLLVRGDYAKKRGVFLGTVLGVEQHRIRVELAGPVKPGDGVVFDPQDGGRVPEQGGRVFEVRRPRERRRELVVGDETGGLASGPALLGFGRHDLDPSRVVPGQRLWKTDDPELTRRLQKRLQRSQPSRRVALDLRVTAVVGSPLRVEGRTATGFEGVVESEAPLEQATKHPATSDLLNSQLGRLGQTTYELGNLDARIQGEPLVPSSLLNGLRRELVDKLDQNASIAPNRAVADSPVLPILRSALWDCATPEDRTPTMDPMIVPLCRTIEQVEALSAKKPETIYLEFQDIKKYAEGIEQVRRASSDSKVFIATTRIEKPGESNLFRYYAKQGADGLLVRNAGGVAFCAHRGIPFVADFSLNAANELSVAWLRAQGSLRVTASYDLSADQLFDLFKASPPGWLEIVLHQQVPMFHMEHCVFCAFLSPGTDKTNCGRPCDHHDVKMRDRVGIEHPLRADIGCRNTLYNALPQTAAEFLPQLINYGGRWFRVEFLEEDGDEAIRIFDLYDSAITGNRDAKTLWKDLKASSRYGLTRGQLAVL